MTEGAMQALRMIMSNESETTRFILSCNNVERLIEPLQSRCIMLNFAKLMDDEVLFCLKQII